VDKGVVIPLTTLAWSPAAMLPLLLAYTTTTKLYKKRGIYTR